MAARREVLQAAARNRKVMDKLEERQRADHEREWARRAQSDLDEIALQAFMGARPAAPAGATSSTFATQLASAAAPTAPATAAAAPAAVSELGADVPFGAEITAAAQKHGIDPAVLAGLSSRSRASTPAPARPRARASSPSHGGDTTP